MEINLQPKYSGLTASQVAQTVNHLPAVWETWVQSLGWEDPLEKKMATHSSPLAWKISWTEEPGRLHLVGYSPWGRKEVDTTERLHLTEPGPPNSSFSIRLSYTFPMRYFGFHLSNKSNVQFLF